MATQQWWGGVPPLGTQDRMQTSQSGGSYIGGMTPQLPTQDMSFMWGGNGSPAPAGNNQDWMQTLGLGGSPAAPAAPQAGAWSSTAPDFSTGGYGSVTGNPQQAAMDSAITQGFTDTLMNQWLPAIQSQAVGTGGLGGARQGVAQGSAIGEAGKGLASALTQSRYGQYNQDANRGLSRYQGDQNAFLTNQGQQLGFYNSQRQLDQGDTRLGMDLYQLGTAGQWTPLNNANGIYSKYTGYGSDTNTSQKGGGWPGAIGGAGGVWDFGKDQGWW